MQLYFSPTSPYARKVRCVLLEKQLPFEGIDVAATNRSPAEHNPLGKVPTCILDDGLVLFDSRVIIETIEAMHPLPGLIPMEVHDRALVRRWEAIGDGICDVLIPVVLDSRRAPELRDAAYAQKLEGKVRASLSYIEQALRGREFVHGERFTLADIAVIAATGYVKLRRPELLDGYPELDRYIAQQLQRPSLASTVPPNLPVRG
ncbi:MAG TPA: glutathione S-transferase family protein [Polyangiaceae bacterium]|nr:glutathione S-transferase family protein [Polyangiaceae bacterium]